MRWVIVRVLPVPAPASTHTGPDGASTAARCPSSSPASSVHSSPLPCSHTLRDPGRMTDRRAHRRSLARILRTQPSIIRRAIETGPGSDHRERRSAPATTAIDRAAAAVRPPRSVGGEHPRTAVAVEPARLLDLAVPRHAVGAPASAPAANADHQRPRKRPRLRTEVADIGDVARRPPPAPLGRRCASSDSPASTKPASTDIRPFGQIGCRASTMRVGPVVHQHDDGGIGARELLVPVPGTRRDQPAGSPRATRRRTGGRSRAAACQLERRRSPW